MHRRRTPSGCPPAVSEQSDSRSESLVLAGLGVDGLDGLAAGLGLNAFVAYGVAALPDMTWQAAMGLVVWEGILILLLVVSGFRVAAFRALPQQMKTAISVGIVDGVERSAIASSASSMPPSEATSRLTTCRAETWFSPTAV